MSSVSACVTTLRKRDILVLYKKLLRYSNSLKYTDKNYYQDRIRGEFWRNRELTESEEVQFQFQVCHLKLKRGPVFSSKKTDLTRPPQSTELSTRRGCEMSSISMFRGFLQCSRKLVIFTSYQRQLQHTSLSASPFKFGIDNLYPYQFRRKHSEIDTSKVPILNEDDLEEWFIKGSGPGGQNVNKRTNCCSLRHKPTGIIVKCHLARELNQNRKLARQMMIEKLDEHFNGDESIAAQKKRLGLEKTHAQEVKAKKIFEMKKRYKDLVHPAEAASDDGSAREMSSEKIS